MRPIECVAIISPGDMGHAVGRVLAENGFDVITCLEGRSDRTRGLAERAGIRDVRSYEELVREADLVLSILVPAEAATVAGRVADAIRASEQATYFADCNAVSPETARKMAEKITAVGGRFIDGSIIGFPPAPGIVPRMYVSGRHASIMDALNGKGIEVVQIGEHVGQASGLKMCYAGLTKGTFALYYAVLAAADNLDLFGRLCEELAHSQAEVYARMQQHLPRLPSKAHRWIGEMEQIAATFEETGITPLFHDAAAEMYRLISQSPLAQETPETIDEHRTLKQTIAVLKH